MGIAELYANDATRDYFTRAIPPHAPMRNIAHPQRAIRTGSAVKVFHTGQREHSTDSIYSAISARDREKNSRRIMTKMTQVVPTTNPNGWKNHVIAATA